MNETNEATERLDVRERFERAWAFAKRTLRFFWVVLIAVLVGEGLSALFLELHAPRYMSETVILYSEGIRALGGAESAGPSSRGAAVRLKETLLARPRLTAIIKEHDLYPEIVAKHGYVDAVDQFRKDIVFRAPGSDTFTIDYYGRSSDEAQSVTASLADSLIDDDSVWRMKQATSTRDFLREERKRSEAQLKDAEAALAKFMADHPEFALDVVMVGPGTPTTGAAIRAAEAEKKAPASRSRARYRVIRRELPSPTARPAPLTAEQRARIADIHAERTRAEAALVAAQANLRDKLSRFTEQHPDVIAAKTMVGEARARLEQARLEEASVRLVRPRAVQTPGQQKTQLIRVAAPAAAAKSKAPDAKQIIDQETEWTRLTRAVTEARERHDKIDTSYFRADVTARSELGGHAGQMVVLDPAYRPPRPVPPGPVLTMVIFFGASLVLGIGVAAGLAAVDDRLYDHGDLTETVAALWQRPAKQAAAEEVEEMAYPVVGAAPPRELTEGTESSAGAIVPAVARPMCEWKAPVDVRPVELSSEIDPRAILLREPESARARSYRALRHRLRACGDPRVIAVTSAVSGEGKTTCALNLALAASEEMGMRVLLVEANLRTPSLANLLSFTPPLCFAEQMERAQAPSTPWVVADLPGSHLHVAAVDAALAPEHRLDRASFASALGDFRSEYNYIVIDTPAALESADVLSIADAAEGLLLAARARQTTRRQIRRVAEQLDASPVLGIALLHEGTVEAACL